MDYQIYGILSPVVSLYLKEGESVITQSGNVSWMDAGIDMTTKILGGFSKGLAGMLTGESIFAIQCTASADNLSITFTLDSPGSIHRYTLSPENDFIIQRCSFVCSEPTVSFQVAYSKSVNGGIFGSDSLVLQKVTGPGDIFLGFGGDKIERLLGDGERIYVDPGNLVAFDSTVTYNIEKIHGIKNVFLSGDGFSRVALTGPGKVYLQTHTLPNLSAVLVPNSSAPSDKIQ